MIPADRGGVCAPSNATVFGAAYPSEQTHRRVGAPMVLAITTQGTAMYTMPPTRDEQFLDMLGAFRLSGGLARGQEMATLLARHSGDNVGTLARWMVRGEVVHFDWQQETWLPLFQFRGSNMAIRSGVGAVLDEFRDVLDPWEIGQWFACPCASLGGRTPADAMALNPDGVLQAARCDRYVVDA
jgi:hypothetical protein